MLSSYKTDKNIYIANLQNIMLYMLTNIILIKNINKTTEESDNIYIYYIGYITAQSIVSWASDKYTNTSTIYNAFLPSIDIYGNDEISDSYINSKRQFLESINERTKCKVQPNIIFTDTFKHNKIPIKYYKFDPMKSSILQYDGKKTDNYINRVYL
jgi:hypothetical protein